ERGIDHIIGADGDQRVAIRGGAHDGLRTQISTGARSIFDDELLAEPFGKPLSYYSRVNVERLAGRKANNDTHRSRRIRLTNCGSRYGSDCSGACRESQKTTALKNHVKPH